MKLLGANLDTQHLGKREGQHLGGSVVERRLRSQGKGRLPKHLIIILIGSHVKNLTMASHRKSLPQHLHHHSHPTTVHFGVALGLCWGQWGSYGAMVGPILGQTGAMSGLYWVHVVPRFGYLGLCWAHVGPQMGYLRLTLDHLGVMFERSRLKLLCKCIGHSVRSNGPGGKKYIYTQ